MLGVAQRPICGAFDRTGFPATTRTTIDAVRAQRQRPFLWASAVQYRKPTGCIAEKAAFESPAREAETSRISVEFSIRYGGGLCASVESIKVIDKTNAQATN